MKRQAVIQSLAALAQESRLDAFRLLVEAGPEGMAAGEVAAALKLAPSALSFHLERLREAELISFERRGRSLIYRARYDTMNALVGYLTENCCRGQPGLCPSASRRTTLSAQRKKETVR